MYPDSRSAQLRNRLQLAYNASNSSQCLLLCDSCTPTFMDTQIHSGAKYTAYYLRKTLATTLSMNCCQSFIPFIGDHSWRNLTEVSRGSRAYITVDLYLDLDLFTLRQDVLDQFLADRTAARSLIGYWQSYCRLSVCLSVTLKERYAKQRNRLNSMRGVWMSHVRLGDHDVVTLQVCQDVLDRYGDCLQGPRKALKWSSYIGVRYSPLVR